MTTAVRPAAKSPSSPTGRLQDGAFRAGATGAGAGILLLALLAPFGVLLAVDGLVTPGDPARTAQDIAGSAVLFRLGIVSLLAVAVIDIVVAWGLHQVLRRTDGGLSALAAWMRLAYATVLLVGVAHLVAALRLLDAPPGTFTATQNQVRALSEIEAFHDVFSAGLMLFGVHLILVGCLAWQSGFVPRLLGTLVCLSGAGYAFDSVAAVLSDGAAPAAATVTFVGELLLGVWLLARGRRAEEADLATHQHKRGRRSDWVT